MMTFGTSKFKPDFEGYFPGISAIPRMPHYQLRNTTNMGKYFHEYNE